MNDGYNDEISPRNVGYYENTFDCLGIPRNKKLITILRSRTPCEDKGLRIKITKPG